MCKIEGLGYHFSHSEGKALWSHCIVSSQVITKDFSFPLGFEQYLGKNIVMKTSWNLAAKLILHVTYQSCLIDIIVKQSILPMFLQIVGLLPKELLKKAYLMGAILLVV